MSKLENTLWVEKYRPKNLSEYVGNEDVKGKIERWIEQGDIPHLLFHGPAGTGKCLHFDECIDIQMELTASEVEMLSEYIVK